MRHNERGITMIGWLFLLIPFAIVAYGAIRLAPIYLNYMRIARTLESMKTEIKADESANQVSIRNALNKHLDIEGVEFPTEKEFQIHRDGQTWIVDTAYEDVAPLFGNVSLLIKFNKSVTIE
jgi:hypothetical protein